MSVVFCWRDPFKVLCAVVLPISVLVIYICLAFFGGRKPCLSDKSLNVECALVESYTKVPIGKGRLAYISGLFIPNLARFTDFIPLHTHAGAELFRVRHGRAQCS